MNASYEAFRVLRSGAATSIQDAGRPNLRRFGIPPSGAMDQYSYRIANLLAGNEPEAAALELTLIGFEAECLRDVTVAITGADLGALLNGEPAPMWTTLRIRRGDRLAFKRGVAGCRAYLAIRGGIDTASYLGSQSVFPRGRMGRWLASNDIIRVRPGTRRQPPTGRSLSPRLRPRFEGSHNIRVILGPQYAMFTERGRSTFLQSRYTLDPRSDRQGLRTRGEAIESANGYDIISDVTPTGSVQVPGDGRPLILHRDGQVTGGYAKIAIVASVDLDVLARLTPNHALHFELIDRNTARQLAHETTRQLTTIQAALM